MEYLQNFPPLFSYLIVFIITDIDKKINIPAKHKLKLAQNACYL